MPISNKWKERTCLWDTAQGQSTILPTLGLQLTTGLPMGSPEWTQHTQPCAQQHREGCPDTSSITISDHDCSTQSVPRCCGFPYAFFPFLLGTYEHIRSHQWTWSLEETGADRGPNELHAQFSLIPCGAPCSLQRRRVLWLMGSQSPSLWRNLSQEGQFIQHSHHVLTTLTVSHSQNGTLQK